MTGPEHYREAERLAVAWQESVDELPSYLTDEELSAQFTQGVNLANQTLAAAQVHATLALAAAAAFPAVRHWCGDEARDGRAWTDVTS